MAVLTAPEDNSNFVKAIQCVCRRAEHLSTKTEGMRHDLLGRIFHAVLDTARYDGSFYTAVSSAVMLAGLALPSRRNIPENPALLRVVDPCCGTGTLLMATAERVKDLLAADEMPARALIEEVLAGYDINITATHMAATTLNLMSPTTKFSRMKIFRMAFGREEGSNRVHAGSLELYGDDNGLPWKTGKGVRRQERADLLIMNPPFTRHDLRHRQLAKGEMIAIKNREQSLFQNAPTNFTTSGPAFMLLADRLLNEDGTMALILPASAASNSATAKLREFLGQRYHIERVVFSHDPKRHWFSENTGLSEFLVVARRKQPEDEGRPTEFVNLAVNPDTTKDAYDTAQAIVEKRWEDVKGVHAEWPRSAVKAGSWEGGQFFSAHLTEAYADMLASPAFRRLEDIAHVGPNGRLTSMFFQFSREPSTGSVPTVYEHNSPNQRAMKRNSPIIQSMRVQADGYLTVKPGKEGDANRFWRQRGRLLIPERLGLSLIRAAAICPDFATIGSAWTPVRFKREGDDQHAREKAMCVYFNSSVGRVALLGARIFWTLCYVKWSLANQRAIRVPDFDAEQANALATVYDEVRDETLGAWREPNCPVHTALDDAVARALECPAEDITLLRHELAKEPMITGRRYGERDQPHS